MRNLLEFLAKYNHWFVFIILEVIGLVLLFQYNNYQGSVWFSSANVVSGKLYGWSSEAAAFFSLRGVNEELTRRNLYLEQQVRILSDSLVKTGRDSVALSQSQLSVLKQYRLIPAKVVSNTVNKADNFITIDKGAADGVHKDMGVACGSGVVGIVYMVSTHYSVVIPVPFRAGAISEFCIGPAVLSIWLMLMTFPGTRTSNCMKRWLPVVILRFFRRAS